MDQLKTMKEQLTAQVQAQMGNIANADAKEMGEAVDMIKDLAEAIYYCTVTKAMEESEKEEKKNPQQMYYTNYYPQTVYRDIPNNRMYYGNSNSGNSTSQSGGMRNYQTGWEIYPMRDDYHEGMSPMSRKTYMESKEMHQSKEVSLKELEKYMQELSQDITNMVIDSTPEEKQMLRTKLMNLADKI